MNPVSDRKSLSEDYCCQKHQVCFTQWLPTFPRMLWDGAARGWTVKMWNSQLVLFWLQETILLQSTQTNCFKFFCYRAPLRPLLHPLLHPGLHPALHPPLPHTALHPALLHPALHSHPSLHLNQVLTCPRLLVSPWHFLFPLQILPHIK